MASIPLAARAEAHPNLRPLNILRDLPAVADLIELSFSDTMDREGQRYVQDMRRAGQDDNFLHWATRMAESTSLPLTGYVWEEAGRLVGNSSLVPFRHNGQRTYLIANVAVHPDFRRRGIARSLTQRSLQHAADRKVTSIWLHVRDDNPGAIELYSELGFQERARRTTWQAQREGSAAHPSSGVIISERLAQHWPQQEEWLQRNYPEVLTWYRSWNIPGLRPGIWTWLQRAFLGYNVLQWSAVSNDERQLEATLAWLPTGSETNGLLLATGPDPRPDAVTELLLHARRALSYNPNLTLEYPAGEAEEALRAGGFEKLRTLIWMQYAGATS